MTKLVIVAAALIAAIALAGVSSPAGSREGTAYAQAQDDVCASASLSFTAPNSLVTFNELATVTVDFGRTFTIEHIKRISVTIEFGPDDLWDDGEEWFLNQFGGQGNQTGSSRTSTLLVQLDPSVFAGFLDGIFDNPIQAGSTPQATDSFQLRTMEFCIRVDVVGGISLDGDLRALPLEAADSSGPGAGLLAVTIVAVIAVAGFGLGSAVWWVRRRPS